MRSVSRFLTLFGAAGEASGPGAVLGPPVCPPHPRPGQTPIDLVVGLSVRAALAVQFLVWARSNAEPIYDPLNWQAWLRPDRGLEQAAAVWTFGQVDPGLAAMMFLAVASLMAVSLATGLFARIAGMLVVFGAIWHVLVVLPEAWPSTLAYGALGLYLALRGAGPASLDWTLARLSRIG